MRFATLSLVIGSLAVSYAAWHKAMNHAIKNAGSPESDQWHKIVKKQVDVTHLPRSAEEYLLETVDLSVNPCDNFYKFACGNVADEEADEQAGTEKWNRLNYELSRNSSEFTLRPIQAAIMAAQNLQSKNATERDKDAFKRRITREFFNVSGISPRIFREDYDEEPTAEQLGKAIGYLASRRLFPLIYIGNAVLRSSYRKKKPFIFAIWPTKQYRDTDSVVGKTLEVKMAQDRIQEVFTSLTPSSWNQSKHVAKRLKALQAFLYNSQCSGSSGQHTLDQLDQKFSFINWTEMAMESGRNIPVLDDNQTDKLQNARIPKQNWRYQMLQNPLKLCGCNSSFVKLNDAVDSRQFSRTLLAQFLLVKALNYIKAFYFDKYDREIPPGLKLAYGRIYADTIFLDDSERRKLRTSVHQITTNLMQAWHDMIIDAAWMCSETRQKALLKLDNMQENLLFPDEIMDDAYLIKHYRNLNITADDSFVETVEKLKMFDMARELEDIFDVTSFRFASFFDDDQSDVLINNAWYLTGYNSITIPLGDLQPPIYHPDWPATHAYSGVGFFIGHEIGHAFDDDGIKFGEFGQAENVLDSNSTGAFQNYSECLANEYDTLCTTMVNAKLECILGRLTLGENMADNSGIRAAYRAFRQHRDQADVRLSGPNLSQYDQDQFFFMFFARYWCKKDAPTLDELIDTHSPNAHRVIGTLRNFPAFQKSFNCSTGSPMVSKKPCELWPENRIESDKIPEKIPQILDDKISGDNSSQLLLVFCIFIVVACYLATGKAYEIFSNLNLKNSLLTYDLRNICSSEKEDCLTDNIQLDDTLKN